LCPAGNEPSPAEDNGLVGMTLNYVSDPTRLFMGRPLQDVLQDVAGRARQYLRDWDPDALLMTAETQVVNDLLDAATFDLPTMHRDQAYFDERPQEIAEAAKPGLGRTRSRTFTRYTLVVPISGPALFFLRSATKFNPGSPIPGRLDSNTPPNMLVYCDRLSDPARIRSYFHQQLDRIQELLSWTQAAVEAHNRSMRVEIPAEVAARRARLHADRGTQASIGFPVKHRHTSDIYTVPLTRSTLRPHRASNATATNPYTPEPTLADADYEAALAVLHRARNALERSPSMTSKMDENEIRDLLLVMLNDHFEGNAGAEVFNCAGRTDILIREQDRHVFIAECKVYDARRHKKGVDWVVTSALNQLLGYLTWRDTKAALLLFVREANLTTVMNKTIAAIRQHPNYQRAGQITNEERHDAIMHANGDPNREIRLATIAFHIGAPTSG
jgi:hypothetical protein